MSEATEALNTTPFEIFAGTTVEWQFSPVHAPVDDFTCTFKLAGPDAFLEIESTMLNDATVTFSIAPDDTEDLPTGVYSYLITASDGTDTFREVAGEMRIDALTIGDNRSFAQKIVDAIDALILGRASTDQMSYQIGNRALSRIPLPDLRIIRRDYANIIAAQRRKQRIDAGLSPLPSIKFKFT
jgi:hypothetical protein